MIRIIGFTIHNGHVHGFQEIEPPIIAFSLTEAIQFGESLAWQYLIDSCIKNGYKKKFKGDVSCHLTYINSDSILRKYEKR